MGMWDAIGGIIGAGASIGSGIMAGNQAKKAAEMDAAGQQKALDLQKYIFDQTQANYKPWLNAGKAALPQITKNVINGDMSGFYKSPGYDFRLKQGVQAIDRGASAGGMLNSGARLKALNDYGQGMASSEYQNYLNNLYNVAGMGQTGAAGMANAGQNYAQGGGAALGNMGSARASGYAAAGNALNQGIQGGIASLYGSNPSGWF
jgi:hypothetical protein